MFLGVVVSSFVLESYRLTSDIAFFLKTLDGRSSDPSYVSLV